MTTKGRGTRVVLPLDSLWEGRALSVIRRNTQGQSADTLFHRLSDPTIRRHLKIIADAAGISQKFTFHSARHTCATRLAVLTGNPFVIRAILGHSSIETSMRYVHTSTAWLEREISKSSNSIRTSI